MVAAFEARARDLYGASPPRAAPVGEVPT
jgi:hypothetical protein